MAGRASIVGAAATHVGNVRDHNEDAHFLDEDLGVFLVCDGMGGHAAGEVASELAIGAIRVAWSGPALHDAAEHWLERATAEAKRQLLEVVRGGVIAAHEAILAEADRDQTKSGMGTTLVGAVIVGGELVFAHAGDSRAYLVRDGISMQLTEDHTLLARLLAAGIDVDVSGEGARFRSMLTNALGIGEEVKVSTFVVPLADGDRFLLCSDGVSEYVPENEVGEVLTRQSSPARAAQRLIDLALERGGGDNATAVVVRVLEAGETPLPAEQRKKDDAAINACALWGKKLTPQQRLRALRIAIPRDHGVGEKLPPHALGDRVAWIVLDGELVQDGDTLGPGALIYPESLISARDQVPPPGRDALASTRGDVRSLAIRANDFRELCDDDGELGEALLDSLAAMIARRKSRAPTVASGVDPRGTTDPHLPAVPRDVAEAYHPTDPRMPAAGDPDAAAAAGGDAGDASAGDDRDTRDRAETVPDEPTERQRPSWSRLPVESAVIAPAPRRAAAGQAPTRPSPSPPGMVKRATPPPPPVPTRPSPPPRSRPPSPPPLAPPDDTPPPPPRASPPTRPSPPPPPRPAVPRSSRPSPPPGASPPASSPPPASAPSASPPAASAPTSRSSAPVQNPAHAAASPPHRATPPRGVSIKPTPERGVARTMTPARGMARTMTPARGVARTATPARGVPRPATPTPPPRTTPGGGFAPVARGEPGATIDSPPPAAARPASAPPAASREVPTARPVPATRPSAPPAPRHAQTWAATMPRGHVESPWDPSNEADTVRGGPAPRSLARPLPASDGAGLRRASVPGPATAGMGHRPTDPEIETYLELEADLPPGPGGERDLDSEAALRSLTADLEEHESVSITIEEEGRRVIETTTETEGQTLTVTVTEPVTSEVQHAITAEDGSEVSGSISIPEDRPSTRHRRARRQSDGWDD
ncbi:MAG TPA: protein phosphatase 2C domain-containing protein [Kofleriaceae bacterium]|nr:protein phosphatase 2C domain-containing protein [Kofleriaceae bacterium]